MPKEYRATFLFGRESDTEDVEGQVTEIEQATRIQAEELEAVLPKFIFQTS